MIEFHPEQLHDRFSARLPGKKAQELMAPSMRLTTTTLPDPNLVKDSSVLICLFPYEAGWGTVLIERTHIGLHAGQISFPGGKRDPEDIDSIDTALREAHEEVGLDSSKVKIIGQLSRLFVPNSNFWITPVVGWIDQQPQWEPNPFEVNTIIPVGLDQLFLQSTKKRREIKRNGFIIDAPYYDLEGHFVWGATAMIISEFEAICK